MSTFKRFLQYYKPYKGIFFMDLFCALIMCIVDLSFPLILSYCTGKFFLKSSNEILKGVLFLGIGLLIMYVIRALCRYYVSCQGHVMGANMESDMRQDVFNQYQR